MRRVRCGPKASRSARGRQLCIPQHFGVEAETTQDLADQYIAVLGHMDLLGISANDADAVLEAIDPD